ncbi:MAG: VOC family protein [Flavobacteriia bacterium]|nr:VOC family protein [Flavobacteriia bacterium]
MSKIICGIQQLGIGVPDVEKIWSWYRKNFGMNVKVFSEAADAPLMIDYTGNKVQSRTATLALNMNGGGGFEIWQYTSRNTEKPSFTPQLGDFGIFIGKIKSRDVEKSYRYYQKNQCNLLSNIEKTPEGKKHFLISDPNGNYFEIVEGLDWFFSEQNASFTGGVSGAVIGVSNIEKALKLYRDILNYDIVVYDVTDTFSVYQSLPSGSQKVRRVLLRHSQIRKGPFAQMLGSTEIELIQSLEPEKHRNIFENRFWGDWGFIHLCFDVRNMDDLQKELSENGFPFTVDSGSTFDMGEASGRFAYVEDSDGTLIEFVETHKVPIMKKWNWYLNLKNRNPEKHLPKWMLKFMGMNKVK